MKKTIFILSLTAVILSSCGGNGKLSLTSYNEKVVTMFNDFSDKIVDDRETIYENKLSKEDNLKLIAAINTSVDSCLNVMNGLNYPDDAKDFHESLVKLYNFSKENMIPLLTKMQDVKPESDAWYGLWDEYDTKTKEVAGMLDEMSKHQEELARKANATLK